MQSVGNCQMIPADQANLAAELSPRGASCAAELQVDTSNKCGLVCEAIRDG